MSCAIDEICADLKQRLIDGIFPDEFVILDLESPYETRDAFEHLTVFIGESGMPYIVDCNGYQIFVYSSDSGVMSPNEIGEAVQQNRTYSKRSSSGSEDVFEPIARSFIDGYAR